jgi:superfamily I DNA/RNA helicase
MHGLPYYYKDKFSVNKKDVAAINTFEKIRKTRQMSETEEMTIKRYVDEDKIDLKLPWFMNFEMENDLMMYYRDLIKNGHDINNKNLMINTIHGVKGGEADNVVIKLDFTKSVRENFENNPDSELRCLYVACTRAKKNLHIVFSNSKNGYDSYIHF